MHTVLGLGRVHRHEAIPQRLLHDGVQWAHALRYTHFWGQRTHATKHARGTYSVCAPVMVLQLSYSQGARNTTLLMHLW